MDEMKFIPGYENMYSCTKDGRVWSHKTDVWLKPHFFDGYHTVNLSNNGVKCHKIHRLVGLTYLENNKNKPCINHINGIKIDNRLENLEWCTYSENEKHAYDFLGKKGGKIKYTKVIQLTKEGVFCKVYNSMLEASKLTGINNQNIGRCISGKENRQTAGGYIWKIA